MNNETEAPIAWGSLAATEEDGLEIVKKSYGWCIAVDGSVAGLVAGDHGFDITHITIPREHIIALVEDWPEFADATTRADLSDAKDKRIAELEAKLAKAVKLMDLSVELATWNTTLLDDVILFITERKESEA